MTAKFNPLPPLELLKDSFSYDPDTGVLTNRTSGKRAGGVFKKGNKFYRRVKVRKFRDTAFMEHRLIWKLHSGEDPGPTPIDHRDGDGTNNKWKNLRKSTNSENMQNIHQAYSTNNSTGLLGVYRHRRAKRFYSTIAVGNTKHYLGTFDTAEEAHAAYLQAKRELHPGNLL